MSKTTGRIDRTGSVCFGDASLSIWEEGLAPARNAGGFKAADEWEKAFKRQVFLRIVQTLNRLGWTCKVPPKEEKQNSASFALRFRDCSKGDLKGELSVMGRSIDFKMWQGINTPTRPDHGGRYESNLEGCMPYVLRLEMERTRRRIRDYLCNVFTGYTFDPKSRSIYRNNPTAKTAMEMLSEMYAESSHFRGVDWEGWKAKGYMDCNRKAVDGVLLEHGQRAWFKDSKGRIRTGIAYYCSNSSWRFVTGRYGFEYTHTGDIWGKCPDALRLKRNGRLRRTRLEQELKAAVKRMDFKRAEVLKCILFPTGPLYAIYSVKDDLYFAIGYCGYRKSLADAGHYTREELKPYLGDSLERDGLRAVLVREAV
jgi:hypothetical protein